MSYSKARAKETDALTLLDIRKEIPLNNIDHYLELKKIVGAWFTNGDEAYYMADNCGFLGYSDPEAPPDSFFLMLRDNAGNLSEIQIELQAITKEDINKNSWSEAFTSGVQFKAYYIDKSNYIVYPGEVIPEIDRTHDTQERKKEQEIIMKHRNKN